MTDIIGRRYEITKLLGKGGMAEVYLAWDTILNREVAVKVLKADMSDDEIALERFKREAGAITRLSHPNIVDVYDVGDDNDKHYIVMEYVKGYTLKQLIRKRGAIPYKEAIWMIKQIASALMEAHKNGIIHRDVKSQNVLIKADGTVKLSDFGIAIANNSMQITSKDSVLGSVHYLAPELSRGKQASMQSDIYSLGIVFYELLTGDVPFKADTPVQVALKHVRDNIPKVRSINSNIPQSVENIITLSTAKSLSNRYKNIALMLKDLNDCLKPEHKNDKAIEIDKQKETGVKQTVSLADERNYEKSKAKFPVLFTIMAVIFAGGLLVGILYMAGYFGSKEIFVNVPDLKNMSIQEANDILSNYSLEIDMAHIEYELSDSIEKNKIISTYPEYNSEVNEGSKVKIVVSNGIASVLKNYVGTNYQDAIKELKELNFVTSTIFESSASEPGTITKQSIDAGYTFDSNERHEITLTISQFSEIMLLPEDKGKNVQEIYDKLTSYKIVCELKLTDKSLFTDEELNGCKSNTVVKTEPELGSYYRQDGDSKVLIYYYIDENETEEGN